MSTLQAPIVAIPLRDDPRDVLVTRHGTSLQLLPANPIVGTSSRRRDVQIRRLRPDARIENIRGNVDTRLRKAEGPEYDAVVLAAAGVHRMGWQGRIQEYFPIDVVVPSPGQGAIAIQAKAETDIATLLALTDDPEVSEPVRIERAFLAALDAGCTMPVGAHASRNGNGFRLVAMLANESGDCVVMIDQTLGHGNACLEAAELALRMSTAVGRTDASRRRGTAGTRARGELNGLRILVTRPRAQAGPLATELIARGGLPVLCPTIRIVPEPDTGEVDAALASAAHGDFDWVVFTSTNAVNVVAGRLDTLQLSPEHRATIRVAAVGAATGDAAAAAGLTVDLVPVVANAEALVTELGPRIKPGDRVLYPRSAIGRDVVPDRLQETGAVVLALDVYRTEPELDVDAGTVDAIRSGDIDAIVATSPSSLRNLIALLGADRHRVPDVPVFCVGPVTAAAAEELGLRVAGVSADPGAPAIVDAIAAFWQQKRGRPGAA